MNASYMSSFIRDTRCSPSEILQWCHGYSLVSEHMNKSQICFSTCMWLMSSLAWLSSFNAYFRGCVKAAAFVHRVPRFSPKILHTKWDIVEFVKYFYGAVYALWRVDSWVKTSCFTPEILPLQSLLVAVLKIDLFFLCPTQREFCNRPVTNFGALLSSSYEISQKPSTWVPWTTFIRN